MIIPFGYMRKRETGGDGPFGGHSTLGTGCILYYNFDSDATDSVGSNDGTVSGATNTAAKINNGYEFDGVNDYITPVVPLSSPSEFSISVWVKSDSQTSDQYIYDIRGDGTIITLYIGQGATNEVKFGVYTASGTIYITTTSYDITQWNHFVLTAKENDFMHVYVNNTEIGTGTAITTFSDAGQTGKRLGYGRTGIWPFDGLMDEFSVWDKALTTDEITDLYNSGSGLAY